MTHKPHTLAVWCHGLVALSRYRHQWGNLVCPHSKCRKIMSLLYISAAATWTFRINLSFNPFLLPNDNYIQNNIFQTYGWRQYMFLAITYYRILFDARNLDLLAISRIVLHGMRGVTKTPFDHLRITIMCCYELKFRFCNASKWVHLKPIHSGKELSITVFASPFDLYIFRQASWCICIYFEILMLITRCTFLGTDLWWLINTHNRCYYWLSFPRFTLNKSVARVNNKRYWLFQLIVDGNKHKIRGDRIWF